MSLARRVLITHVRTRTVARASLDTLDRRDSAIPLITVIPGVRVVHATLRQTHLCKSPYRRQPEYSYDRGYDARSMTGPTCRVNPAEDDR